MMLKGKYILDNTHFIKVVGLTHSNLLSGTLLLGNGLIWNNDKLFNNYSA